MQLGIQVSVESQAAAQADASRGIQNGIALARPLSRDASATVETYLEIKGSCTTMLSGNQGFPGSNNYVVSKQEIREILSI